MSLFCCLLLVVVTFASSIKPFPTVNVLLDHFIHDLTNTVTVIQQSSHYLSYLWVRKSYAVFDVLNIPSTGRLKICNFNLTAEISMHYKRIGLRSASPNLAVSVLYYREEPSAIIRSIHATDYWTGTEIMHIVHDILQRLEVREVGLDNVARLWYEYEGTEGIIRKAFISLIELRCIRGKIIDWYAEFGNFNG